MQPTSIDPTVKALVSALGEAETGTTSPEAYTKRGASGEYGRYQFRPDTWNLYAKEAGVASPLEQSSIEDQNKVAYTKISQWKQQGYTPAQIASMWNAGPDDPDAYKGTFSNGKPSVGVNSMGVQYNVPEYTPRVSAAYQRLKGQSGVLPSGQQAIPGAAQEGSDGSFLGDVGETFSKAGTRLSTAVGQGLNGEINPLSATLQGVGALGGAVGDLTTNALEHLPLVGTAFKGIEGAIGKGVQSFVNTDVGKGLVGNYEKFKQAHPEAAGNIGAAFDIATAYPLLKGLGAVKNVAKGGLNTVLRGAKNEVYEAVAPKLGPKGLAKAIVDRGTVKKGLLRTTELAEDPYVKGIADTVKELVPKFNPAKPFLHNISEVQKVTTAMKDQLKKDVVKYGADRIYPKRELISTLKKLELPDLIASDATLTNVYKRLIKRVEGLMAEKPGKVSDLLDLRQEFDAIVRKQFPNLYRSEALTPMRHAIGDIRNAITEFTAKNLPEGFGLKESLFKQHQLIKAIENMSVKAATGQGKEIGKNILTDKFKKTRGLIKLGGKAALEGTGVGAMMHLLD